MDEFRYELHAHTNAVSSCATASPEEAVACYRSIGYDGIVITEHLYEGYVEKHGGAEHWDQVITAYLKGYQAAQKAAEGTALQIFLGMELRFGGHNNDYLVYGITEDYLRSCGNITVMTPAQYFASIDGTGIYIAQAHPFRNYMTILPPENLHGMEIQNGCVRHNSRNNLAALWAKDLDLVGISGSDFHVIGDEGRGGVILNERPKDAQQLADRIFRQKEYKLIIPANA